MSDDGMTPHETNREIYAAWYEWARRTQKLVRSPLLAIDEAKVHAAAWAAATAASRGAAGAEIEQMAKQAMKDKQALSAIRADTAMRAYAQWFYWAVTNLGVSADKAQLAAAAALSAGASGNPALAAETAAGVHGDASRAELAQSQRDAAFVRATRECPFPVTKDKVDMPGGMQLMNDEFLVTSGRDWGFSSQRILITTHRAIWTHGRIMNKQQNAIYLTDIRDVVFRKPLVGYGSLAFETSSGHVIEALPSVSNGAQVRNSLLTLIHYARNRTSQPAPVAASVLPPQPAAAAQLDRYDQLKKLAELKAAGILSDEEFQSEKAKILAS